MLSTTFFPLKYPIRYGIVSVIARPQVLTNSAMNGENKIPLARYSADSGKITVRLFKAKNKKSTAIARHVFSGVYFKTVFTDIAPSVFLITKISITIIIPMATVGINIFIYSFFSIITPFLFHSRTSFSSSMNK